MPKNNDDLSHIPNVAYVSPLELKPNRVLLGLGVGVIVLVIGTLGYLLVDKLFLGESATAVPNIEITKKSPVTKVPTPGAQIDTTDWKTYKNEDLRIEIKYPGGWYVYDNVTPPCTHLSPIYVFINRKPITDCQFLDIFPADFYIVVGVPWTPESDENDTYKPYVIDGQEGFINITTEKSQGPRPKETRVIVTYQEKGYMIGILNTDYKGTHDKIYDQILATFKFLN